MQPESQPITDPITVSPSKNHLILIAVAVVVLAAILITGIVFAYSKIMQEPTKHSGTPTVTATKPITTTSTNTNTPTASPTPPYSITDANGVTNFSGEGISIKVNDKQTFDKNTYGMEAKGDIVYVGVASDPESAGQYVEVFSKSSSDSLVTAITKQILQGYSTTDCPVNLVTGQSSVLPASYQIAAIHYSTDQYKNSTSGQPYSGNLSCPNPYTANDDVSYFAMDPTHPTLFVYIQLGNGGSPLYGSSSWISSLTFLN